MRRLDPNAFAEQLHRSAALFWCVAAGVTADRSSAEDLVQEAAVIALGKLDEFDADTSFQAWMSQIVRNVARNAARMTRRRQTRSAEPEAFESVPDRRGLAQAQAKSNLSTRGDLTEDDSVFDDRVLGALRSLEETPRVCLLLRTLHDVSYRELSLMLGIPEGTAMSHVHRARHQLREVLSASGAAAPTAKGGRS